MATKTKKRPAKAREPKPKQGHLDGMEPPSIPEIDSAADSYVEARDTRMSWNETETERKEILRAAMLKHELNNYEYDGKIVELDKEPSVHVKKKKVPKPSKNGDGEDND